MVTIVKKKLGFFGWITRFLMAFWQLLCGYFCWIIFFGMGAAINEGVTVQSSSVETLGTFIGAGIGGGMLFFLLTIIWFIGTVIFFMFVKFTPRKIVIEGSESDRFNPTYHVGD